MGHLSSTSPQFVFFFFLITLIYGEWEETVAAIRSHGVRFLKGDNTWALYPYGQSGPCSSKLQNEL